MKVRKLNFAERKIIPIFPQLLYQDQTSDFEKVRDGMIEYAYNQEKKEKEDGIIASEISNRGGWQTSNPNFFTTDESFQVYFNWITEKMKEYIDFMDFDLSQGFDVVLKTMWFNINRKGNYNISHHHPNSQISGVLWIKTPPDCGMIGFENPQEYDEYVFHTLQKQKLIDEYFSCGNYKVVPKEGMMIMFPAHMRHYVQENKSDEDRISLAFNIQLSNVG